MAKQLLWNIPSQTLRKIPTKEMLLRLINHLTKYSKLKLFCYSSCNFYFPIEIRHLRRLLARLWRRARFARWIPPPLALLAPLEIGSKTPAPSNSLRQPWRSDWSCGLERPRRLDSGRGLEVWRSDYPHTCARGGRVKTIPPPSAKISGLSPPLSKPRSRHIPPLRAGKTPLSFQSS